MLPEGELGEEVGEPRRLNHVANVELFLQLRKGLLMATQLQLLCLIPRSVFDAATAEGPDESGDEELVVVVPVLGVTANSAQHGLLRPTLSRRVLPVWVCALRRSAVDVPYQSILKAEVLVAAKQKLQDVEDYGSETANQTQHDVERVNSKLLRRLNARLRVVNEDVRMRILIVLNLLLLLLDNLVVVDSLAEVDDVDVGSVEQFKIVELHLHLRNLFDLVLRLAWLGENNGLSQCD